MTRADQRPVLIHQFTDVVNQTSNAAYGFDEAATIAQILAKPDCLTIDRAIRGGEIAA
jgi:hypothetical protein